MNTKRDLRRPDTALRKLLRYQEGTGGGKKDFLEGRNMLKGLRGNLNGLRVGKECISDSFQDF